MFISYRRPYFHAYRSLEPALETKGPEVFHVHMNKKGRRYERKSVIKKLKTFDGHVFKMCREQCIKFATGLNIIKRFMF